MRNYKLKKFERNHYYYGKLLSVRDFLLEQNYFNSKRYTINRTVLGSGIVFGLLAKKGDDSYVNVSSGMAVDDLGREIIVPEPQQISVMSAISKVQTDVYIKDSCYGFYLCAEYSEHGAEEAFSIADTELGRETAHQHNHIHEGFKFSILPEKAVPELNSCIAAVKTVTIYKGDGIEIQQSAPEFVNPNEVFEVVVKVKKTDSSIKPSGKLTINHSFAGCRLLEDSPSSVANIFLKEDLKEGNLLRFLIKAGNRPQDARVGVSSTSLGTGANTESIIHIIEGRVIEDIVNSYFGDMPDIEASENRLIYIAKLTLKCLNAGNISFSVEKVENVSQPLKRYLYNNNLLYDLIDYSDKRATLQSLGMRETPSESITSGSVAFEVKGDIKEYNSDEIDAKLGSIPFGVKLGLLKEESEAAFYGDAEVLNAKDSFPVISMGAFVYPEKGKFTIRILLKDIQPEVKRVTVKWWTFKADVL